MTCERLLHPHRAGSSQLMPHRSWAIEDLRRTLKLSLRNTYTACLNRLPETWVLPIRDAYVNAPDGSMRRRLSHRILKCVRYKHPDRRVQSFALAGEPAVRLANVNSIIVRHLYWFGKDGWEGAERRAWRYFCARATNILEIGANIGFYTVCGAQHAAAASYTAVEPHPRTSRILRRNLELNGLERVRVLEAAVVGCRTAERMTLMVPVADQDDTPPGSFLASGGEVSRAAAASYEVPVIDIRDVIRGVDLLKLDVEGYEHDILGAVRDVLVRERPTIFVEVLSQARKLQQFVAELARSGAYTIYVCGDVITHVDPDVIAAGRLMALYRTRDVFLVRADQIVSPREILG